MSIKAELQRRLLDDMIKLSRGRDQYVVLVVDPHTSKIISSCCRMYDVMEAGVLVLQNIRLERERMDLSAVYFVTPTDESVRAIIKDFDKPKAQYEAAHLFFTGRVSTAHMKLLAASKLVTQKKIRRLQELNVDFVAAEARMFHFMRPQGLRNIFMATSEEVRAIELSQTSAQLVSFCLTMKEFPFVRFANRAPLAKKFAIQFENDMKRTVASLSDWKYDESRARGTLLVIDRTLDPVAPLMHEYTYQAMVSDLLQVDGELCFLPGLTEAKEDESPKAESKAPAKTAAATTGARRVFKTKEQLQKEREEGTIVLSEDDSLWCEFRHRHIAEVMHDVNKKFREFKSQNKMASLQDKSGGTDGGASVKDMIAAMKEMPTYKAMMKKYHKHMSLAQACMALFDAKSLRDLGELEQDMATGLDNDGKAISEKAIKSHLVTAMTSTTIGILEKLRLLMIYVISQGGMQESTRKELLKSIDVRLQRAIRNLGNLGVNVAQVKGGSAKHTKERIAQFAQRNKTIPLALMRYLPFLSAPVAQLVLGTLDEEEWPYVSPPPPPAEPTGSFASTVAATPPAKGTSDRKKKTPAAARDWRSAAPKEEEKKKLEDDKRQRFIIFVLGGVTFAEMRSIYELAEEKKVNLIIGSSHTLTPREYIYALAEMPLDEFHDSLGENKDDFVPNAAFQYGPGSGQSATLGGSAPPVKRAPSTAAAASSSAAPAKAGAKPTPAKKEDSDSEDDARPTTRRDHAQLANQLGRL